MKKPATEVSTNPSGGEVSSLSLPSAIVTNKSEEALDLVRHSTAHLLAQAVKQLFPEAQVTIGPVIENGFFYDFAYERAFTPEDLEAIEKRMAELHRATMRCAEVMPSHEQYLKSLVKS